MAARKNSSLLALLALIVVVAGLVGWLVVGMGRRANVDGASNGTSTALAENHEANAADTSRGETVLAEVPRAETSTQREAAPIDRARIDATQPNAGELKDAYWVEGTLKFPEGTPLDERVTVVAQGREFQGKKLHRSPVGADGSFRVAFSKQTKKAWLRLESRYVFLDEATAVDAKAQPRDVVLTPHLGGGVRVRLVPNATAAAFSKDLVGAVATVQGWTAGSNRPPRVMNAAFDERLECEFGGLNPDVRWSLGATFKSFASPIPLEFVPSVGRTTPLDLAVERGMHLGGVVRDEAGTPIAGAFIRIEDPMNGHVRFGSVAGDVKSDANGRFSLDGVGTAVLRIAAVKSGYASHVIAELQLVEGGSRDDLDFRLSREPSIRGVVRWANGTPAADARITVESRAENTYERWWLREDDLTTKTGADGTFVVAGLRDESYRVTALASLKGSSPSNEKSSRVRNLAEQDDVAAPANDVVLVLAAGSSLAGRVVDDIGAPVTTFSVRTTPRGDQESMDYSRSSTRSIRNDDGRFELAGLGDGEWDVRVSTKIGEEATSRIQMPSAEAAAMQFVLPRPANVRGVVLDPLGVPVPNARFELDRIRGQQVYFGSSRTDVQSRKSDEKGQFSFPMPTGAWRISANASPWVSSESVEVEAAAATNVGPITLTLRNGGAIKGLVLDRSSQPSANRAVSAHGPGEYRRATTDAKGSFELPRLEPGDWTIQVEASQAELSKLRSKDGDYDWEVAQNLRLSKRVTVVEGASVEVTLGGPSTDSIQVFGFVRGDGPIENVRVSFSRESSEGEGDEEMFGGNWRTARTNADGRYEVTLKSAGKYSIYVQTNGGANAHQSKDFGAGTHQVDFTLPTASISGSVVGADGAPVAGATVMAYPQEAGNDSEDSEGQFEPWSGQVETDARGNFRMSNVSAGTYRVVAASASFGRSPKKKALAAHAPAHLDNVKVAEGARVDGLVLRMKAGGTLNVVVLGSDGTPKSGVSVSAQPSNGMYFDGGQQETDRTGRATFAGLGEGPFEVHATGGTELAPDSGPIKLGAGETKDVTLRMARGGSLRVFVSDAAGNALSEWVSVEDEARKVRGQCMSANAAEDQDGIAAPLLPGRYHVIVRDESGEEQQSEAATVTAGTITDVRIVKRPPSANDGESKPK